MDTSSIAFSRRVWEGQRRRLRICELRHRWTFLPGRVRSPVWKGFNPGSSAECQRSRMTIVMEQARADERAAWLRMSTKYYFNIEAFWAQDGGPTPKSPPRCETRFPPAPGSPDPASPVVPFSGLPCPEDRQGIAHQLMSEEPFGKRK